MRKLFQRMFAPLPNTLDGYAAGVEKPTTTLAKMIALSLMTDDITICRSGSIYDITHPKFKLRGQDKLETKYLGGGSSREYRSTSFHNEMPVQFTDGERELIHKGVQFALDNQQKHAAIKAEAEKQHKAVNVIESWFKTPEEPPEEPVKEPVVRPPRSSKLIASVE